MPVTLTTTIIRSPDCLAAKVDEELVLMSVERGLYLALDNIGSDIWQRIAEPCTIGDLCTALQIDYEAPRAAIEADVLELLATLAESGVVEVRG